MFSPSTKLLWTTLLVLVPVLAVAGVAVSTLALVLSVALLAFDAHRLHKLLDAVQVSTSSSLSAYKDRATQITVSVQNSTAETRIALALPVNFHAESPVVPASAQVEIEFTPQARGEFTIREAHLSAASPWRMWNLRVTKGIHLDVNVFPDLSQDAASRKLFTMLQQGQRIQRLVGRGREVERLRDYAAGDSFDEIYWKATARRGMPVSKVFQVERTQDIYAIVDGSRLGSRNQALERFVTASLLLAVAAEKNTDNFGLVTFSDQVHHFVRAAHGKGHFQRCREAIFNLQPVPVSPDFAELFTFLSLRIRKRSLLFFLTDLSDPLLSETFTRDASLIARRHVILVDQIADAVDRPLFTGPLPASDAAVETRLAGHLQWAKLRELERSLSHIGIRMHLLKPEQTSSELIGQYLNIKQRQLL